MIQAQLEPATLDDLLQFDGKAELDAEPVVLGWRVEVDRIFAL